MADQQLTPVQAAEHLGVSVEAIYVLNSRKYNGFPRPTYTGRTPTWTPTELDDWRAAHPPKQRSRHRETTRPARREPSNVDFHDLRAHLAFMTERSGPALTGDLLLLAEQTMRAEATKLGAEIEEFHSTAAYLHLLARYPIHISVANLASRLRGATVRTCRQSHMINGHLWMRSYYAASAAAHSTAKLSQYVERLEQTVNN
ncbi:transposase [Streptomyces sp. NPDC001530]|uniref:transposase n=1 Tax=Streptomyces sp. NPDC001530 TaxID=3364582 RepID=UPI0036C43346